MHAAKAMLAMLFATTPLHSMATSLDADDLPTVVVRVDNVADVSAESLRVAEDRASDVFGRVGARLRWVDEVLVIREHLRPSLTIVLVRIKEQPKSPAFSEDVLGFAARQGRRAYVFYDRIEALNERSQRSTASLLGDAMAHELGHLLLPTPGHSLEGIMRRSVDINVQAVRTFTRAQAREIVISITRAQ